MLLLHVRSAQPTMQAATRAGSCCACFCRRQQGHGGWQQDCAGAVALQKSGTAASVLEGGKVNALGRPAALLQEVTPSIVPACAQQWVQLNAEVVHD
jgi:hypothetical protein